MKKILVAAFACLLASPAFAVCPSPVTGKDAAGTTQNFGTVVDGAGSCEGVTAIVDSAGANKLAVSASGQASINAASGAYAAGALASGAGVDGWDLTQGAKGDTAWTSGSGSVVAVLKAIAGNTAGAVPAGTNLIGKFGIDQTTPGTTNGVQVNAALPAGTNLMGKVGIDQTTPGTTNGTQDASTGSTGSAPPTKATYNGSNGSGATGGQMRGQINCDNHVFKHITTATDTLAVQGVASQTVYICGWRARAAGVATWFLENTASVNANCSSTLTQITGVATEAANTGEVAYNPFWGGLKNTSANGLCISSTGTGGVDVDIWYAQF